MQIFKKILFVISYNKLVIKIAFQMKNISHFFKKNHKMDHLIFRKHHASEYFLEKINGYSVPNLRRSAESCSAQVRRAYSILTRF